jgi:hypothetical protein
MMIRYRWIGILVWACACGGDMNADRAGSAGAATATATDGSAEAGSESCVERTEIYADGTQFAYDEVKDLTIYANCAPSCGAAKGKDGFFLLQALPAGACTAEPPCARGVSLVCPCGEFGAVHGFRCICAAGRWSCTIAQMGGAICLSHAQDACSNVDGGAEAALLDAPEAQR